MFWSTSRARGAYKQSVQLSAPRGEYAIARQNYVPESRSQRKEFAMARRQETLLCIDDNQSSLNICKIILEDFGYKVLTASSAREGLEIFASHVIDAVILDYQMPEMNGELVAAEMRRTKPRVPILMLSGWVFTARKRASTGGRICRQRRPGRVHAPSSSASIESWQKAKARKSRYSVSGGQLRL